ncbi:MAG: transglycosylase domain-containing protein [Candidatus Sericytochromatia bacterium]
MKPTPPSPDPQQRARRQAGRARLLQHFRRVVLAGLVLLVALGIGTSVALFTVYQQLPDVRQLENYTLPMATEIYTEQGRMLTRISSEGRYDPVPLSELPQHVQDAVISAEDRRFWQHEGVDFLGLMRAIYINLSRGRAVMGASTLTQQLIKNLFLSSEQSAQRKIAEALLAFQLERKYSKQQILEMYLNLVFLGHNVYGVEAASQVYFGKSARQLTIGEAALLAGIIRSPEYFSPYHRPDGANELKEIVLNQMEKDQRISAQQKAEAIQQPIRLVGLRTSYPYPYFLDYVMYTLRKNFGDAPVRQGGWKVYTTIDPSLQRTAEQLLAADLPRLRRSGATQASLVSLDPRTGYIKALVGGVNYAESQFNRAFQAQRQVGSTFKPFVYLTAFENGMRLQDTLLDAAVNFGGYRPRNASRTYRGNVSLLQALTSSLNVPTVRLANQLGMGKVINTARRAGVESPIGPDLASSLGASEMNLLELTSAYGTFANNGLRVMPTAITRIVDAQGQVVWEAFPEQRRVFDAAPVGQLHIALQNVIQAGTGTAARIGRPAAGKTGTTDNAFDTWFVGYVPQLVTGVWAGNDTPSATRGGGGTTCAPLWRQFMLTATRNLPVEGFEAPELAPVSPSPSESASATAEPSPSTNEIEEVPLETPLPDVQVSPSVEASPLELEVTPEPTSTPIPLPTLESTAVPEETGLMELGSPEGN